MIVHTHSYMIPIPHRIMVPGLRLHNSVIQVYYCLASLFHAGVTFHDVKILERDRLKAD